MDTDEKYIRSKKSCFEHLIQEHCHKLNGFKRSVYVMRLTVISEVRKIQILKSTSFTKLRDALLVSLLHHIMH